MFNRVPHRGKRSQPLARGTVATGMMSPTRCKCQLISGVESRESRGGRRNPPPNPGAVTQGKTFSFLNP